MASGSWTSAAAPAAGGLLPSPDCSVGTYGSLALLKKLFAEAVEREVYAEFGKSSSKATFACKGQPCRARMVCLKHEAALRSPDVVVSVAARGAAEVARLRGESPSSLWVVKEVRCEHGALCTGSPSFSLEKLAKMPGVWMAFARGKSQAEIIQYVKEQFNVELTPTDVSRLHERAETEMRRLAEGEMKLLVPVLEALTKPVDGVVTAGAVLVVRSERGEEETVNFGMFRPQGSAPFSVAEVPNGGHVVRVLVVWPWALTAEECGPPVVAMDACHMEHGMGFISQIAMRGARLNIPLVTQWQERETADDYYFMITKARLVFKVVLQPWTSLISDRGMAIYSCMLRFTDVQHLLCKMHLRLNVFAIFPRLAELGDEGLKAVNEALFCCVESRLAAAHSNLDRLLLSVTPEYAKDSAAGKGGAPGTLVSDGNGGAPPVRAAGEDDYIEEQDTDDEDDEDDDDEFPNSRRYKVRHLGGVKPKRKELPSEYLNRLPRNKVWYPFMTSNDFGVTTTNAAEASGSPLKRWGARRATPAAGILIIWAGVRGNLYQRLAELRRLDEAKKLVFPCWPFWERWRVDVETAKSEYRVTQTTDLIFTCSPPGAARNVQLYRNHEVALAKPGAPAQASSAKEVPGLSRCSNGCRLLVRERVACPHALLAVKLAYPVPQFAGREGRTHSEQAAAVAGLAAALVKATLQLFAPFYQVDYLLQRFEERMSINRIVPGILDLVPGPALKPIVKLPSLRRQYDRENGGRPGQDPDKRFRMGGEAEIQAARGGGSVPGMARGPYACRHCKEKGHKRKNCPNKE